MGDRISEVPRYYINPYTQLFHSLVVVLHIGLLDKLPLE